MLKAFVSVERCACLQSAPKDSPYDPLKVPEDLGDVRQITPKLHKIFIDAKALNDFESVVTNFPDGKCVDKDTILALINTHRSAAEKDVKKNDLEEILRKNMTTILDAKKAIKKAEYLEEELERLRKKKNEPRRPGGGLGGAAGGSR
jgi:hypothetical protein